MNKKTILIVEDDIDFAKTLEMILELNQQNPIVANNGEEAVELAKQYALDVCFVDVKMAGMSGFECVQKLRRIVTKSTKIIMMTGFRDNELYDNAIAAGADRMLLKPFSTDEFVQCI